MGFPVFYRAEHSLKPGLLNTTPYPIHQTSANRGTDLSFSCEVSCYLLISKSRQRSIMNTSWDSTQSSANTSTKPCTRARIIWINSIQIWNISFSTLATFSHNGGGHIWTRDLPSTKLICSNWAILAWIPFNLSLAAPSLFPLPLPHPHQYSSLPKSFCCTFLITIL